MRAVEPGGRTDAQETGRDPYPRFTYTARRIVAGHCPDCGLPLAVLNDGGGWPLAACLCEWVGQTTELVNRVRLDEGWLVSDQHGQERELRP